MNGAHATREAVVREPGELLREVDEGSHTTASPELVGIARRLYEANTAKMKPVEEALAAISRVRAEGGTLQEQEEAAMPHMAELRRIEGEMDGIIEELARLAPAGA